MENDPAGPLDEQADAKVHMWWKREDEATK